MAHFGDRTWVRLAAVAALAAGLALSGCGRKGPLDPPPTASITAPPESRSTLGEMNDSNMTGFRRPPPTTVVQPAQQTQLPQQRSFILDPLIK